jgi:hypothetical protein
MSGPSALGHHHLHPLYAAEIGRYCLGALTSALLLLSGPNASAASCDTCHSAEYNQWASSPHASTQQHPATELSQLHVGQSPAEVLAAQDCIACHSPTSITVNGGMTEAQAMGYFFTTSNGVFTANTTATNTGVWPHVACTACHLVSQPHEFIPARLAIFDSPTGQYRIMTNATQLCGQCHGDLRFPNAGQKLYNCWVASQHANSQTNVAKGLSQCRVGQTPTDVIYGTNADNCIACHSPTSVLVRGGDEALALGNFFSTSNGVFTTNTVPINKGQWPGIECIACHDPHSPGQISYFNSTTQEYQVMTNASQLCGQCHGTLRFPNTDYRLYDAWSGSKHAHTQNDVATELSQSRVGQTPQDVIHGPETENCIACHAPTSVLSTGGDEVKALAHFFTTTNGQFSSSTVSTNTSEWPSVTCTACHDPHTSNQLAYFNSGTGTYQAMTNSAQLCGQCHGNLRFPDTDHLSYNILTGKGGIGVLDQQLMGGVTCTECHMHTSDVTGSNSKMAGGHSWAISVSEPGGQETVSCLNCHDGATPDAAYLVINGWQSEFQALETTVVSNVTKIASAVQASANPAALSALAEAQHNLAYAQGDESGGFHNHPYLMALLNAANQKALSIRLLNATRHGGNIVISWIGSGTLQSATSMKGPWQDVSGATNPLVIAPAVQGQQQYYRLRP